MVDFTRRGFVAGLFAMPIVIRTPGLLMPIKPVFIIWGDDIHDDAPGLQALITGKKVLDPDNLASMVDGCLKLNGGTFYLKETLRAGDYVEGGNSILRHDGPGPALHMVADESFHLTNINILGAGTALRLESTTHWGGRL